MPRLRLHHSSFARRLQLTPEGETGSFAATTLGEAIAVAERMLAARIVPHDPPKWFRVYLSDLPPDRYGLVDVHIQRDGDWFCPQQDISVTLLESDIVSLDPLIC